MAKYHWSLSTELGLAAELSPTNGPSLYKKEFLINYTSFRLVDLPIVANTEERSAFKPYLEKKKLLKSKKTCRVRPGCLTGTGFPCISR